MQYFLRPWYIFYHPFTHIQTINKRDEERRKLEGKMRHGNRNCYMKWMPKVSRVLSIQRRSSRGSNMYDAVSSSTWFYVLLYHSCEISSNNYLYLCILYLLTCKKQKGVSSYCLPNQASTHYSSLIVRSEEWKRARHLHSNDQQVCCLVVLATRQSRTHILLRLSQMTHTLLSDKVPSAPSIFLLFMLPFCFDLFSYISLSYSYIERYTSMTFMISSFLTFSWWHTLME